MSSLPGIFAFAWLLLAGIHELFHGALVLLAPEHSLGVPELSVAPLHLGARSLGYMTMLIGIYILLLSLHDRGMEWSTGGRWGFAAAVGIQQASYPLLLRILRAYVWKENLRVDVRDDWRFFGNEVIGACLLGIAMLQGLGEVLASRIPNKQS